MLQEKIGHGGQGEVWALQGGRAAAKFLTSVDSASRDELRTRLRRIARTDLRGIPLATPQALIDGPPGYIMELLEDMVSLGSLFTFPKTGDKLAWYRDTGGLRRRLVVLANVADALHRLHSRAMAYCDLSPRERSRSPFLGPRPHLADRSGQPHRRVRPLHPRAAHAWLRRPGGGPRRAGQRHALTWPHVHLPDDDATRTDDAELPHVDVFRSVRTGGDTKTRRSRRSLAIPNRAVRALRRQHTRQAMQRDRAGDDWQDNGLVFASQVGTEMDRHNVLRGFRRILKAAGLNPDDWTPRELRHSFVSLLSDAKVPIEVISRLVGHSGTAVTGTGLPTPDPTSSRGSGNRDGPHLPGHCA